MLLVRRVAPIKKLAIALSKPRAASKPALLAKALSKTLSIALPIALAVAWLTESTAVG